MDRPPPYSASSRRQELPASSRNSFRGPQSIRTLSTRTGFGNISGTGAALHLCLLADIQAGTYCVDPALEGHALEIQSCHRENKGKGKKLSGSRPDATFYSKHGAVKLHLAASGYGRPARIHVGTYTGDISITSVRYSSAEAKACVTHLSTLIVRRTIFKESQCRCALAKRSVLTSMSC